MKRLLTAAALIPPVAYGVLAAPAWVVLAGVTVVACLCYYEFQAIARVLQPGSISPIGFAAGLALLVWPADTWLLLTLLTLSAMAWAMRGPSLASVLPRASFLVLGVLYIFGAWKCAVLIRQVNPHWLMFVLLLNWVGDAGAYYVGRNFGRHKLAPRVSPAKTWEGSAGSLVTSLILAGGYLWHFIPGLTLWRVTVVTIATNLAGQLGDLAESAIKRGAGVKDSGTLLPGHGGMLDRVDSTIFALPVVYAWLRMQ